MPILPPLRSILSTVTAAADRAIVDPLLEIAAASYVPAKPMPEPSDYCGVIYNTNEGIIVQITDAATMRTLADLRTKVISSSDGERGMKIVEVAIGKALKPGQPTSRILDVIEATQRRGYELLGVDFRR